MQSSSQDSVLNEEFLNLTPNDSAQGVEPYIAALEYALDENHKDAIKNIAITGPYASGKSSFLQTYKTGHPGKNYLNISLATFCDKKTDGPQSN